MKGLIFLVTYFWEPGEIYHIPELAFESPPIGKSSKFYKTHYKEPCLDKRKDIWRYKPNKTL